MQTSWVYLFTFQIKEVYYCESYYLVHQIAVNIEGIQDTLPTLYWLSYLSTKGQIMHAYQKR